MNNKRNQRLFGATWLIFAIYLYFRNASNISLEKYLAIVNISTLYWLIGGFILGILTVYISHKLEMKDKQSSN